MPTPEAQRDADPERGGFTEGKNGLGYGTKSRLAEQRAQRGQRRT